MSQIKSFEFRTRAEVPNHQPSSAPAPLPHSAAVQVGESAAGMDAHATASHPRAKARDIGGRHAGHHNVHGSACLEQAVSRSAVDGCEP